MNYLPAFIAPELVQALGWTILHSLWQGALVAITLSLLMILLHRHSAKIRYGVATVALFTALLMAGITFVRTYRQTQIPTAAMPARSAQIKLNPEPNIPAMVSDTNQTVLRGAILVNFKNYFSKHLPVVVLVWLLGMLMMLLKFLGGLAYIQRLKHYKTHPLSQTWHAKLREMAQRLPLRQTVQLAESTLVKTPLVIGYLKPLILLPLGTVAALSPEQVEAILAHELAHIYRKDYLLNMLQGLVEILFFFNPAIWWISDYVRIERENCCDDQAIVLCGNPLTYARALANLENIPVQTPRLALAFAGKDGSLLGRIKRLVQQPNLSPTFSEGFLAACVIIVGLTVISASALAGFRVPAKAPVLAGKYTPAIPQITQNVAPTLANEPNAKASIYTLTDSTGKKNDLIIIKNKKGTITELYVDGQKIPQRDIPQFQSLINQSLANAEKAPRLRSTDKAATLAELKQSLKKLEADQSYSFTYHSDFQHSGVAPIPPVPPVPAVAPPPPTAGLPATPFPAIAPPAPLVAPRPPKPPKVKAPLEYLRSAEVTEKTLLVIDGKKTRKASGQDPFAGLTKDNIRGINVIKGDKALQKYGDEGKEGVVEITTGSSKGYFFNYEADDTEKELRKFEETIEQHQNDLRQHTTRLLEHTEKQRVQIEEQTRRHERQAREHEARAREHEQRARENEKRAQENEKRFNALKQELINDQIIGANDRTFKFKFNKEGMFVNDKKQPTAVYEKYRRKFYPEMNKNSSQSEEISITVD